MKKDRKNFITLRRSVIRYNKALVCIFALYMLYALIHSISILDCKGIDFYNSNIEVTKDMLTCTNMSTGLLAFFRNNNLLICTVLLLFAVAILVLQKIALYKINKLDVNELQEEKVYKTGQILFTLLLGYTGIHKFRTENKVIGNIYLVNFVIFIISWLCKNFFAATYNSYLMFYCSYEFSLLFLIGILILNVIEAIFSLISLKDDDNKIFA